ncbi:endonuclease [Aliiglaciecola lipolytica]|uniref:Endonuclease I n=1 Tax=Aliiglaciecola lipolytica E3 TaxID=1127673 RepID=K6YEA9_9ALTE|nr:endonuclease [Aliiglaciecola lipolytica]GAC16502.1 endonuclease I [Aliiglaciecola lipolytica E3]
MKKLSTLLFSALLISQLAHGNVTNGEFEDWSSGTPDSWTTIDSGISTSESTSVVKSGSSAAAINVNTATQGSTDFRQSIAVNSGQTIEFSTWVYHTEGGMRARLYVDGYRNYSNASITNQWQQLSYTYTANTTGNIEVGLRFYDVSGFDGSEVVYIDDFQPNSGTNGGGTGGGTGGCQVNSGSFELLTDNYASETSWEITNAQSSVEASGSGYANNTSYSEALCLADGEYTLTINDAYGDGICCSYGSGSYELVIEGTSLTSGGNFASSETFVFTLGSGGGTPPDLTGYYADASGLTGYNLKTALYDIIKGHSSQGYGGLWTFYSSNSLDQYYENDGSILDIYAERPSSSDPYTYSPVSDQCGNYSGEGSCYNREHSFPRSWFGGAIGPMNSDVHHIFATDGYVNSKRGSYPYGEVSSATYTSQNGSLLGSARSGLGYSGTVFEPIDEFKGDLARAYFYMATRYENVISAWESNSSSSDAALNGSSNQVFENWFIDMLKTWHNQDPVSQLEIDRNEAAHSYQGNRNPFVDHPEFVGEIWGN